jgi:hypothetical protein
MGVAQKGYGRVNTVQKMCRHACKCKNETCCNYSRNWGSGDKGERWWVNSSMICLIHWNKLCKCHSVPPTSIRIKEIKRKNSRVLA